MVSQPRLPRNKTELENREAAGFWRTIALSRAIGESKERITLSTILRIHKTMLGSAYPDIAGRFRKKEDVKKLKCIEPPPGREVEQRMYASWKELDVKLATLPRHPKKYTKHQQKTWRAEVVHLAAWTQHQIAAIHPFCEGNGRIARLMTNLILRRYGLPPTSVDFGRNREDYLHALCQIDRFGDYEPLETLIVKGVMESYKKEEKLRLRKRVA
ncbi:MAG: Adenosine monophosphate-protein transferase FICD-like protein [Candidatus Jorgensenbacteria bacterium GW2011_GWB1_50_10]|uniref:Adenosine monophosphate-protein transferase FICD-like protein n=1 Tax=Candidatus Jorgensenbacteria bacterium GW2011_GWB1_50_10 TaxID=1618665 RepID=A0A0G1W778_9BACT|nr:MAG: Adenosine monophosphate-protein transferase FICD-like protein [Candidatus Jorgensenbacteria bacterium GW2011_GWB1_50_10]